MAGLHCLARLWAALSTLRAAQRGDGGHGGECFRFHTLMGWHVVGSEHVAPSHHHKSKQVSFLFGAISL